MVRDSGFSGAQAEEAGQRLPLSESKPAQFWGLFLSWPRRDRAGPETGSYWGPW